MARSESTQESRDDAVTVPVIGNPGRKAPPVDPHLRPETVSKEIVKFGEIELPPVLSGIQPGLGLNGAAKEYPVRVIWASRSQVEQVLSEVERIHPDTSMVMQVVRSFMCHMDTIRDEAKLGVLAARGWVKPDTQDGSHYRDNLDAVVRMLGRWDDEHRLHIG